MRVRWLPAVVLAVASVPPVAAGEPADWLVRVSDAARQSTYQGVVVYRDARMMEVLRVSHRVRDGRVQERLTSLTGKPRDILREGDHVACLVGDRPLESAGGIPAALFPAMSAASLGAAAQHYQLRDLGQARVAGRACRGVVMEPRDEFRYGYEVCADEQTAVPLRVVLRDAQGRPVEQLLFTEITFPAHIGDAAFTAPPGLTATARDEVVEASATAATWQLASLPPGFRVILRSHTPAADGGIVEHVLLSDGLSAVSVFGAQTRAGRMFNGFSHMGAMNAYGRAAGPYHVTVVGEVPQATVRLIGDGFRLAERAKAQ